MNYQQEYYQKNKEKMDTQAAARYAREKADPARWKARTEKSRFAHIKRTYGLSADEYCSLIALQDNKCLICKTNLNKVRVVVDHDHESGHVRGILCHSCNTGIGMLKDDPALLDAAKEYLKEKQALIETELKETNDRVVELMARVDFIMKAFNVASPGALYGAPPKSLLDIYNDVQAGKSLQEAVDDEVPDVSVANSEDRPEVE